MSEQGKLLRLRHLQRTPAGIAALLLNRTHPCLVSILAQPRLEAVVLVYRVSY